MVGAASLADALATVLRERVAGKTHYDIQEAAALHVKEGWSPTDDVKRRIKAAAYEAGLNKAQVLHVIAIEVRDRLLRGEAS